jgi:hypothetical protein
MSIVQHTVQKDKWINSYLVIEKILLLFDKFASRKKVS